MSDTPIYDSLLKYKKSSQLRLHMPGHMGKGDTLLELSPLASFDVTELPSTGDLMAGSGPFKEFLDLADAFYGGTTVLSVNGASQAVKSALALACGEGGKIVVDRNCHRSVLDAMILLNLEPVYAYPAGDDAKACADSSAIEELLCREKDARAVIITCPSYYGSISDIEKIAAVVHSAGKELIVDNAHGSHLAVIQKNGKPMHPFFLGADYCIDSLHKTLPALTGCAFLHCHDPREDVLGAMRLFGSSSPSFPLAASAELAFNYLKTVCAEDVSRVAKLISQLAGRFDQTAVSVCSFNNSDPLRLCLDYCRSTLTPLQAAKSLEARGINVEMYDDRYLVLLFSPLFDKNDLQTLERSIIDITGHVRESKTRPAETVRLAQVISPRKAYFSRKEKLRLSEAAGRIAAEPLYLYPPGIPLCMPGEQLTADFCRLYDGIFDTALVLI